MENLINLRSYEASSVNFNLKKKGLEDKISLAIVILRCIEMFTNYLLTFL